MSETLGLLQGPFATVCQAIERRCFALWFGSGISLGRVPGVKAILEKALEHLKGRINPAEPHCKFKNALLTAISYCELDVDPALFDRPVHGWPPKDEILKRLQNRYADVLDIRIDGEADDYMLWVAVDVRNIFGKLNNADVEHLCIAQ